LQRSTQQRDVQRENYFRFKLMRVSFRNAGREDELANSTKGSVEGTKRTERKREKTNKARQWYLYRKC